MLMFIYANDRLTGFCMKHRIKFLAEFVNTEHIVADEKQIEKSFILSSDYFGLLAGTVLGILASLFGVPSLVFDWLHY